MRFFNKLERRFGRYAIHNLMYYIIIMYVMGFVMMYMDPMFFTRYLSLDAEAILHGQVWRLVTFLLYPHTEPLLDYFCGAHVLFTGPFPGGGVGGVPF